MAKSHQITPKLERIIVTPSGDIYHDQNGKYARWQEAQWLVERQHQEILRLRTELNRYKSLSTKRFKQIETLKGKLERNLPLGGKTY